MFLRNCTNFFLPQKEQKFLINLNILEHFSFKSSIIPKIIRPHKQKIKDFHKLECASYAQAFNYKTTKVFKKNSMISNI